MWKKFLFVIVIFVPLMLHGFTQERELYSQAQSRYLSNNYTAAYDSFDEIVRLYPLSDLVPDAQYWKAVCLFRLGKFDESIDLFEIVERRYRATRFIGFVPFWKGVAYFQKGSYIEALENLDDFLKNQSDFDIDTDLGNLPAAIRPGIHSVGGFTTLAFSEHMDGFFLVRLKRKK